MYDGGDDGVNRKNAPSRRYIVKARPILNTRQTAQALGVGLRHVLTLLYEQKLPGARKVGRVWQIPASAIEARLKVREQAR